MKLNTKSLEGVEIGIPVIAEGVYHARMEKVQVATNKKGDGNNLSIMFRVLDNPVVSYKEGKELVNNGQVCITRWFSMVPTPDYDPDKAMKELAVAIKLPPEQDLTLEDLKDKIVMIKVEHQDEQKADPANNKKAYPESNAVRRITPMPEEDTFSPPPF